MHYRPFGIPRTDCAGPCDIELAVAYVTSACLVRLIDKHNDESCTVVC
jgi:hypothetical protein